MMLLLAIDTSGRNGSLALARVGEGKIEVVEAVALAGGTFSAQLVPEIAALLAKQAFTKSDLAAFAVVSGPGSFTGLRVGLAAIKAFAEILQKPIAAVSLLEAVASSNREGRVLACLDAGRDEVYVGDYELTAGLPRMRSERLLTREEFLTEARVQGKRAITPDAALVDVLRVAGVPCEHIGYPGCEVIAGLGWQHIQCGRTVRPEDLEANYIRRSDAEIFSQPRH